MKKKLVLLAFPFFGFAYPQSAIEKQAYYKGIRDAILYQDYQNSVQIPDGQYWVVIDLTEKPKTDWIALGIYLKAKGFVPVLVKSGENIYLLVYTSNSRYDAEGIANQIGIAKAEVIDKPERYEKILFRTPMLEQPVSLGKVGILDLLNELEKRIENLNDVVEKEKAEKLIEELKAVLQERQSQEKIEQDKTEQILKNLFGGE